MTNQEAMCKLSQEEFWKKMMWLITDYGMQYNSTRFAVIEWLKQEAET